MIAILHALLSLALAAVPVSETGLAPEGSPFRAVQEAIARDDLGRAKTLLAAIPLPPPGDPEFEPLAAKTALLGAAAAPEAERPRRFLGVAGTYAAREEGLTALVAALASSEAADLAPAAAPLVDDWLARRDLDPRVALASALLERALAGPVEDGDAALRLGTATPLPVPQPLAEPIRVRLHRIESIEAAVDSILDGVAPRVAIALDVRVEPKDDAETALAAPGPGDYLLEIRSLESRRRSFRRLRVSDLDVFAHAAPTGLAALATFGGRPAAGVEIAFRQDEEGARFTTRTVTGSDGVARADLAVFRSSRRLRLDAALVDARGERHSATVSFEREEPALAPWPQLSAHVLVDRPIYRPGETVQGRVVVRRFDPRPASAAAGAFSPVAAPLASRDVRVRLLLRGQDPRTLTVRTDDFGAAPFEFVLAAADPPGVLSIEAELPVASTREFSRARQHQEGDVIVPLASGVVAEIAEFRRPPLLVRTSAPAEWRRGTADPEISVRATLPAGPAAAGIAGRVRATAGSLVHEEAIVLDARGEARARLRLSEMDAATGAVPWSVVLTAPDGQSLTESGSLRIEGEPVAARDVARIAPRPLSVEIRFPKGPRGVAGEALPIEVDGPAGAVVFLSVVREAIFESRVIALDASGRASVSIEVDPDWYPRVGLLASAFGAGLPWDEYGWYGLGEPRHFLDVALPDETLRVTLEHEHVAAAYAPGDDASFTIVTRDSSGAPRPATVAMSIVDETVFALGEDRTPDPVAALRPSWLPGLTRAFESPRRGSAWSAIGERLRDGRVPLVEMSFDGKSYGFGGASGGRRGGDSSAPRVDFRPTAFFAPNVRTDLAGRATVRMTFPDDVTTWRVTLVAVGASGGAAMSTETVRTEKAVAVEPLLPRLLREGDRLRVVSRVTQAAHGEKTEARLEARAEGPLRVDPGTASRDVETRPGAFADAAVEIAGGEPGDASIALDLVRASNGEALDRVVHPVRVASASAFRETSASSLVDGATALEPEWIEGPRPAGFEVEILASADALLRDATRYLAEYPHGCAEQTASRLVPLFVAMHASLGASGGGPARLLPADAHRLEVGLARLRALQTRDGGFAWWDGGEDRGDPWITANVFRALALAREAGLDPATYGIRVTEDLPVFREIVVAERGTRGERESVRRKSVSAADLAASALLLFPASKVHRESCLAIVSRPAGERFPDGVVARAARALALAGETVAARAALDGLLARWREPGSGELEADPDLADESPGARAAALLDLVLAARPEDPARARLVAEILRMSRGGRIDHTSATAAAVVALARDRAMRGVEAGDPGDVSVTVEGGGETRTVVATARDAARLSLPAGTRRVVVTARRNASVVVTATARFAEDVATAAPLAEPIAVERRLARLVPRGDGSFDSEPLSGRVRVGDLVEAVIEVTGPRRLAYVLVECPVPAGFEVTHAARGLVARDDRASIGLTRLDDEGRATVRIRFISAIEGDVAFPPATAEAMYVPELRGRSRGERLVIEPARAEDGAASAIIPLLGEALALERLARLESHLARDHQPATLLSNLSKFPHARAREVLFDSAPGRLGARLLETSVMEAYVRALGARVEARLSGESLEAFYAAIDAPRATVRARLATVLANAATAESFVLRWWREEGSVEDRRLGALTLFERDRYPAEVDPLRVALRFVSDDVLLRDAEVRDEWRRALRDREGSWRYRARSLLVEPARRSFDEVFLRDGHVAVGAGIDRARLESVRRLAAGVVAMWIDSSPAERAGWADELNAILSLSAWPAASGAREPAAHAEFRREMRRLRDRVTDAVFASPPSSDDGGPWRLVLDDRTGDDFARVATRALERIEEGMEHEATEEDRLAAGASILSRAAEARGSERLRSLALRILGSGPRAWREGAWDLLSDADRAAVPASVLLAAAADDRDAGWAARALVHRGGAAAADLVRVAATLERGDVREIAAQIEDESALAGLPAGDLAALAATLDPRSRSHAAARARHVERLVKSDTSDAVFSREFAARRDPRERAVLARVLAERGVEPAFEPDDPAAERWRALVAARRGDFMAGDVVRAWLGDGKTPEIDLVIEFSFIAPHARPADFRLNFIDSLDNATLVEAIRAVGGAGLLEALRDPNVESQHRQAMIRAADEGVLRDAILRRLVTEDARIAVDLLDATDDRRALRREFAEALLDHGDESVRTDAARVLFEETGIEGKEADGRVIGATTPEERRAAARRRARETGVAALEGDVETLSALGIYLTP